MSTHNQGVTISTGTIVRAFAIACLLWVAWIVRDVMLLIFISFILATIMHPAAAWAEKKGINRGVTVAFIYVIAFAAFVGVGWALAPLLVYEISQIAQNFGDYWDRVITLLPPETSASLKNIVQSNINSIAEAAKTGVAVTLTSVLSTVRGVIQAIGSFVVVLVLTFYFVVEEVAMKRALLSWIPIKFVPFTERMLFNSQFRLGGWARGQLILSLLVGICVYIALTIIGVPYPFALAALAALLEFIPYAGPILSSLFGIFFALSVSPFVAIITAAVYYAIQVIQNNVMVPKIMQKAAGVNPALSIMMILLAYELMGVIGVFLGVPAPSLLVALFESFPQTPHH